MSILGRVLGTCTALPFRSAQLALFSLSCKSPLLLFLLTAAGVATRLCYAVPPDRQLEPHTTADPSRHHQVAFRESRKGSWELQGLVVETHVSEPEGLGGPEMAKHSITQPIPVICKPPFLSGSQPLAG